MTSRTGGKPSPQAKSLHSQAGFTLPEIMVTVGIVGLLSAIAIPSYQKYSARARQAEAKASLTGIYTAENNYAVDARTYTNCLLDIGVPSSAGGPARYYGCGIAPYTPANVACGPGGGYACNNYVYDEGAPVTPTCANADLIPISETASSSPTANLITTTANYGTLNYGLPGPYSLAATGVTNTAFVAACAGNISTTGYDNWDIDNNQVLQNLRSGI